MNPPSSTTPRQAPAVSMEPFDAVRLASPLSWSSIFAGCFAGLGLHLVLTLLGVGIGAGVVNPLSNDNPAADFTVGAGIVWSISALVALWAGGYIAGRSIPQGDRQSGLIHGFVVWGVATVAMFLFLTSSAGMAIGGAAQALGKGVAATAQVAGAAAPQAGEALGGQASQLIAPYMDELGGGTGQLAQRDLSPTAKREITVSLTRFFSNTTSETRNGLITALSERGGVPRADAERMVSEWEASYRRIQENLNQMRAEAEQTAREAAEKAASSVSRASIWTFIAFVLGAIAASLGGRRGASSASTRDSDAEVVR